MPDPVVPGDSYPPPPTRQISWQSEVLTADPDWQSGMFRPWTYQFSNGRTFYWDNNVYTD